MSFQGLSWIFELLMIIFIKIYNKSLFLLNKVTLFFIYLIIFKFKILTN